MLGKTLLLHKNGGECKGTIETEGNVDYDVIITRDGVQIYSLPTGVTPDVQLYEVSLAVSDVIEPQSGRLTNYLDISRNIEFEAEMTKDPIYVGSSTYIDTITKLTVTSVKNDFYFKTGCFFPGMSGGSN